jgi:hypothetical protein
MKQSSHSTLTLRCTAIGSASKGKSCSPGLADASRRTLCAPQHEGVLGVFYAL